MKKATKAALLSGLVFPGLGHLYLKRWLTGALLAGVAAYAVYTIASVVLRVTRDVTRQIESGAVPADIETLTQLVAQQLSGSEQATSFASTVLMGCWVVGLVGAYFQGRLQDRRDAPSGSI
jgi:TM2 domain-containing membrane protein YozV